MSDTQTFLLEWFRPRVRGVALAWDAHSATNYFEVGWIDSFASLELVEEIERRFQLRFTESDLADPRFATLAGLAAIVDARRAATR